ncbi:MAG: NAD(P)/FAD-dependent oxidoreductase [Thermoplasmata archaeon]|jgi:digeranylgeranylglycerophospholipid reductase|nr:NAD(P)/FAD-dependent oxidoreductase [Thermoplasmata archaeon]
MTEKVDVLVVGSGPAGSVAARYAAMSGATVKVLERRPKVGVPVRCGEFMPSDQEIQDMFPKLKDIDTLFNIPDELRCRQIIGIDLVNPKDKVTKLEFSGYTTDRDRFDQYLAQLAQEAGAEISFNESFDQLKDGVAVTDKGEIEYKVLIGADGPGSRVAQSLGLKRNMNPYPAFTTQVKGDFDPCMKMFFGGIAPGAYGWIIPKDGRANVGVGFSPKFAKDSLKAYFDKFMDRHGFEADCKVHGKYVPSEGPIPKTVSGNGMVVGDAAGQVISVNGGGIPLAMIAGRICGTVAGENVRSGASLENYESQWRDIMGKPLKTAAFNKKLADIFAFRSDFTTNMCMGILGKRRMGNLIRCKRIFP